MMKKRIAALVTAGVLALSMLTGCGSKQESWKVTCPWAPSGVAAMVSQKAAAMSPDYSDKKITLVAEAIKGDAATVNTWVSSTKANDKELVFAGEGLFAITETLDPAKLQFSYDDFEFVENLYSSVFVLSADSSLNLKDLDDLEAYVKAGNPVSVAVNGATGSEAFLAAALFGSMGAGDQLKLTPYQSAAVSHQSQILETYQQGGVDVVCAFDDKAIENGPFAGVEGVGSKGYPYFRNRCFVMARKGTDAAKVAELKELYDKILADQEMVEWLNDTMLLEVDTMSEDDVKAHIENVKSIVEQYKDIVAG